MSNSKVSILDVASWFLSKEAMTHKKLQKLCYYVQAWGLALYNKELIDSEFQAWVHGPVSRELYNKYKSNGWEDIPKLKSFQPSNTQFFSDEKNLHLLDSVWFTYGNKSGNELEALTHQEEPWINARKKAEVKENEPCNEIILSDDMKVFYKRIYIGD
jgi:cdsE